MHPSPTQRAADKNGARDRRGRKTGILSQHLWRELSKRDQGPDTTRQGPVKGSSKTGPLTDRTFDRLGVRPAGPLTAGTAPPCGKCRHRDILHPLRSSRHSRDYPNASENPRQQPTKSRIGRLQFTLNQDTTCPIAWLIPPFAGLRFSFHRHLSPFAFLPSIVIFFHVIFSARRALWSWRRARNLSSFWSLR